MLSIIIPLLEGENKIHDLLKDIDSLNIDAEILLVFPEYTNNSNAKFQKTYSNLDIRVLAHGNSRATQMNYGASVAKYENFCFLHADSRLTSQNMNELALNLRKNMDAIFYFKLGFEKSSCSLIFINALGANLRSKYLKAPFGDQGLSMSKKIFNKIGAYPVHVEYGEDNLFILQAKKLDIPIVGLDSILKTSARKYEKNGWLKITLLHQYLWLKQNLQFKRNNATR